MNSFLGKAADSAKANITVWKARYPDPGGMERDRPPRFLPGDILTCGIIAEVKRRSPSAGDLIGEIDPLCLPVTYENAGAEAVSVVVEEQHFGGSPELFKNIADMTTLPLLWKDFVVDPYQISLAAGLGASGVLLIAGMLSDVDLLSFMEVARQEGLRSLVEIHDEAELERAVDAGADLIGVNNRDLVTLEVDVSTSERLMDRLPHGVQAVSESGIQTPEDVACMANLGCRAVLIGQSLVTAEDTEGLLKEMVKAGRIRRR